MSTESGETYNWNAIVYNFNNYPPELLATNALFRALEENEE